VASEAIGTAADLMVGNVAGSRPIRQTEIQLLWLSGPAKLDAAVRSSSFSHTREQAHPDYYQADITEGGIQAGRTS
jgi:hypothetical protein